MGGKRVFIDDIEQQIIQMHREGKCLCEIAETFNIGMETIRRRLRQHGYSNMRSFIRPGYEFYCRWCGKKLSSIRRLATIGRYSVLRVARRNTGNIQTALEPEQD